MDLLRYIRLGIQYHTFFSYDSHQITIRPITSMELDDASNKGYEICDTRLVSTLVKIRSGVFKADGEMKEIPPDLMLNMKKFRDEVDYHIVYYSMKDFMSPEFIVEDVRKMHSVHAISSQILGMSVVDKPTLIKIIRTRDGQKLAKIVYDFKVPLTDAAWKLTDLQTDFLYYNTEDAPIQVQNEDELEKVMEGISKHVK